MTIAAVDSPDHHLELDSIPVIDLTLLSQSELTSLSLCSQNAFDLHRCDDIVIPKIDRSVFNESAGSRKQTYSRLRLAPRKPEISAVGRGRYNPVPKPHSNPVDDPERKENKQIVSLLRQLFGKDSSIQFKDPTFNENYEFLQQEQQQTSLMLVEAAPETSSGVMKRKRGRPRKEILNFEPIQPKPKVRKVESEDFYENVAVEENVVMEIVNKNGVVVDLAALAASEDPFGPELTRRSAGLTTEEELLAFLRDLNGQWGSRRKKRKVVDACDFGDALPVGWKLLLSLKRKEGNLSLYCRRYISPTGQQFVSCKDVSSYLLPFFGFEGETHPNSFQTDESDYEPGKVSSGSSAGLALNEGSTMDEMNYYDASPIASFSPENEKQLASLGTENLADVEIKDLLECHICKTNFDEKDAYLQHLLSSHQRSSKKLRHGNTSVCDGVIIKDGKYECQFCHKVFDERHRYNGHVGVHVRNFVRSHELQSGGKSMLNVAKPPSLSGVLPGFSGVDASVQIEEVTVPLASIPNNETTMSGFSRVDASVEIDKVSAPLVSISNKETTMSGFSSVEASDDTMDKGNVASVSVHNDEITVENKTKPSLSVLPGFSSIEGLDDIEKAPVPPISTSTGERSTENIMKELPVSGMMPELHKVESAVIDEGHHLPISIANNETDVQDDLKPSSVSGVLLETKIESPCGELDSISNSDGSSPKEQKSPHSEPDVGSLSSQSSPVTSNIEKVDPLPYNRGPECMPGDSTSTSKSELKVDPPCEGDMETNIMNGTLGDEAGGKQNSGIEMTDDKQCSGDKLEKSMNHDLESCLDSEAAVSDNVKDGIPEAVKAKDFFASRIDGNSDKADQSRGDLDIRSCLGSATALCNNDEGGSSETFEGKNVFSSTTEVKFEKVDQKDNDLHGDFRSFLGSAVSLRNDPEHSTNTAYEGNNVLSSTASGINLTGFKHGESSFSFSFAPSGTSLCDNVENDAPETSTGKDVFRGTYDGKLGKADKANSEMDGDFRSCLGSATALLNNVQNGTSMSYEGSNLFTSTATAISMSGFKTGDSSFNFSFAPSVGEKTNGLEICKDDVFSMSLKEPELVKGSLYEFNEPERCFRSNMRQSNEFSLLDSVGAADKDSILHRLVADTSSPLPQSSGCFRTLDLMPHKGQESENFPLQKFENMSGFEELGLDDLEPSKFSFVTGKQSSSLTQEPMDLAYDSVMEEALNTTVQFEWEPVLPKMDSNQQQSTICVWCRLPFINETINHEMQSDSVGFMCPTCKANISGQLNVLDNDGLSLSFDHL